MRRLLIFTFAVGLLALGGLNAQAGLIPLPTDLGTLSTPGNFTTVPSPAGNLTFADFTYSPSPVGSPPAAGDITVGAFSAGIENGVTFGGAFTALPAVIVDYALSYLVTAPQGFTFTDATLSGLFKTNGGNGAVSVVDTLLNAATGSRVGTLVISSVPSGSTSDTINFAGVNSLIVDKDLFLVGGSLGASVSLIDQGYSVPVPEPTSMALLAIGLCGLFTLRPFLKRASVA
jgi:PEP-CTERM motif